MLYKALAMLATCGLLIGCETAMTASKPDYRPTLIQRPDGSTVAVPAHCPGWDKDLPPDWYNADHPMLGCADAHNFAVMLADPNDIVRGRPLEGANATTTTSALQRYKANAITPLPAPASASGGGN